MSTVLSGLDVLLQKSPRFLRDARIGVIGHQASVDSRLRHIIDLLRERKASLTAIFAPEHGLWGTAQDQIPITTQKESTSQLPIYSLYGDQRVPTQEQLAHVDVLICDLQDVGSRYYTFIWTMALALQACARHGKKFVILDRPNPIDGRTLEGPVLDLNYASFVGLYALPVRHGMTIGEIGQWINATYQIGADLEVIPLQGWKRSMEFAATGLPWVPPSPNMPTLDTALIYPGGCLIEGTNLSEGRGTTRPFEWVGAPYLSGDAVARLMNSEKLPGVHFRACYFEPTFHKFQGNLCGGVQMHITDRATIKPFFTVLSLIKRIFEEYSTSFAWRDPPYEYEKEKRPFDILCGTDTIRKAIETSQKLSTLEKDWKDGLASFARERKPFLLYN